MLPLLLRLCMFSWFSGAITSLTSPSQLFGQPQVASPQFFLTGNPLQTQTGASGSVPIQQLLIPVSTGNQLVLFLCNLKTVLKVKQNKCTRNFS